MNEKKKDWKKKMNMGEKKLVCLWNIWSLWKNDIKLRYCYINKKRFEWGDWSLGNVKNYSQFGCIKTNPLNKIITLVLIPVLVHYIHFFSKDSYLLYFYIILFHYYVALYFHRPALPKQVQWRASLSADDILFHAVGGVCHATLER